MQHYSFTKAPSLTLGRKSSYKRWMLPALMLEVLEEIFLSCVRKAVKWTPEFLWGEWFPCETSVFHVIIILRNSEAHWYDDWPQHYNEQHKLSFITCDVLLHVWRPKCSHYKLAIGWYFWQSIIFCERGVCITPVHCIHKDLHYLCAIIQWIFPSSNQIL